MEFFGQKNDFLSFLAKFFKNKKLIKTKQRKKKERKKKNKNK